MMPQLLTVRVGRQSGRPVRVWVPILPVVLVLLPLVALVVLAAAVACLVYRINAIRALGASWRLISALPGTRIDVTHGHTAVLVNIR